MNGRLLARGPNHTMERRECFHVLTTVNTFAMNTGVHVSFTGMVFTGYIPRSRISEPCGLEVKWSDSVMSDSLWLHGLQLTRLLRPWGFPGKSTGVGCHCLLQDRSNRQIWPWSTGQRLMEFCQENPLVIANTLFQHKKTRLYTWTSPVGQYWNQIDYILCS